MAFTRKLEGGASTVYWPYSNKHCHSSAKDALSRAKFDSTRIKPGIRRDAENNVEANIIEGIVNAYYRKTGNCNSKTGLSEIKVNGQTHKVTPVPARAYSAYKIEGFPNLIFKMRAENLDEKLDPQYFMKEGANIETVGYDLIKQVEEKIVDGIRLQKIPGFAACAYVRHPDIDGGVCIQEIADINSITLNEIEGLYRFLESNGIRDFDTKDFNLGVVHDKDGRREAVVIDNEGIQLFGNDLIKHIDRYKFWVDGSLIESKYPSREVDKGIDTKNLGMRTMLLPGDSISAQKTEISKNPILHLETNDGAERPVKEGSITIPTPVSIAVSLRAENEPATKSVFKDFMSGGFKFDSFVTHLTPDEKKKFDQLANTFDSNGELVQNLRTLDSITNLNGVDEENKHLISIIKLISDNASDDCKGIAQKLIAAFIKDNRELNSFLLRPDVLKSHGII